MPDAGAEDPLLRWTTYIKGPRSCIGVYWSHVNLRGVDVGLDTMSALSDVCQALLDGLD